MQHECCGLQNKVEECKEKIEKLVKTSEGMVEDAEWTMSDSEIQLDKGLHKIDRMMQDVVDEYNELIQNITNKKDLGLDDLTKTKKMSLQEYKIIRCKQDELIMRFKNTFYYGKRLLTDGNPHEYFTKMKQLQSMVEENNREEVEYFEFITDIRYPALVQPADLQVQV